MLALPFFLLLLLLLLLFLLLLLLFFLLLYCPFCLSPSLSVSTFLLF